MHKLRYNRKKGMCHGKKKQMFPFFKAGSDLVKMKKPGKKNALIGSWERPYLFVRYVDE
jgi:hypothetical protein